MSSLSLHARDDTMALPHKSGQAADEGHSAQRLRPWSIAVMLLLITGSAYYLIRTAPFPLQNNLDTIPLTIGSWSGEALPIEREPLRVAGADQELVRRYHSPGGRSLTLYMSYFDSQEQGKKLVGYQTSNEFHRGEVEVTLPTGTQNAYRVNQAILRVGQKERFVLFWYDLNGRMATGRYEAKFWTLWNALTLGRTNGALVAVSAPLTERDDLDQLSADVHAFAHDLIPILEHQLPGATG